jgi:DNA-binding GntR family transcriptional regulator
VTSLAKIDAPSLRQRVYRALQKAILTGALAPTERIRDQELALRLGVSRTPVREALQRLEDEGLVETAPRASTRVAPLDATAARQAYPVVAALYALATRLAAPSITMTDLAALREANETLARMIASPDSATVLQAIAVDDRFHQVFFDRCGNREIERTLERLLPKIRRLEYARFASLSGMQSVRQHEAMIDACVRGDADEAARLAEENCLRRVVHID